MSLMNVVKNAFTTMAISALIVSTATLSGCASNTGSSSNNPDEGNINWWGWTPDIGEANELIAAFQKDYPKIKVTYKKIQDANYNAALRPALVSANGPDVFDVAAGGATGDVSTFGSSALSLSNRKKPEKWTKGIYSSGITAFEDRNGDLKAAPVGQIASGILWINQDLFDKYGQKPPTNLKEWINVCKVFRSNGVGCLTEGIGQPGFDIDTLHSISDSIKPGEFAKAASGKQSWNNPTVVEAFKLFKQLESNGILDSGAVGIQQYPDVNNSFLAGKSAMVQMGTWYQQYTTIKALKGAQEAAGLASNAKAVTMVPISFPDVAGKGNKPNLFGDPDYAVAVSARSKSSKTAQTFAKWISSDDAAQKIIANSLTDFPVKKSISVDWGSVKLVDEKVQRPALQELKKKVSKVDQARQANLPANMIQALVTADQDVISGRKQPAKVVNDIQTVASSNRS